jgi:hypothetical protein
MLQFEEDRQRYLAFLASAPPDDPRRRIASERLRQVQQLMAAQTGTIVLTDPGANTNLVPPPGTVTAMNVPVAEADVRAASSGRAPATPPVQQLRDPNELYTDSVKNALIDVMLRHSSILKIRENEWLTVAASDSDGPQQPGQVEDLSRILISIRGVDLLAFKSGKLTREEVLKKVEVREF